MKVFQDISDNVKEMSNFEARNYVIGFIGKKLGLRPRSSQKSESWISLKGKGRLFEPSDELINICEICDRKFDEFHKDGLKKCNKPFNVLFQEIISNFPSFPPKVVKLYCKVKFYARIRMLNRDIKLKKIKKSVRMFKQTAQFMN